MANIFGVSALADVVLLTVLGLIIGSFLNVVIYRLPLMLQRQWLQNSKDYLEEHAIAVAPLPQKPTINLATPASACPNCGVTLRWYQNIPVLSFIFLKARCANCKAAISWRYPLVELLTALLFVLCYYQIGISWALPLACIYVSMLIAMTGIDWDTTLLPDQLTLGLLWLGLLAVAFEYWPISLFDAVLGAVAGYLTFWIVCQLFYLVTKKQGMGNGDFKLLAALGVWLGWQALLPLILVASAVGAVVGIGLKLCEKLDKPYIPFGPFLALAGVLVLLVGKDALYQLIS